MNARAIRKRLMRNRMNIFWGARAMLTVRFPLSLLPPQPEFTPPGKPGDFEGNWECVDEDGNPFTLVFSNVSSGGDPRLDPEGCEGLYFIEETEYGGFKWWETYVVYPAEGERSEHSRTTEYGSTLAAYVAHQEWQKKYLVGYYGSTGIEPLDALLGAANAAKTTYHKIVGDYVYLTYSVKYFYHYRARRFASDLSWALDICKKHNVPVRVMRGAF